MKKAEKLKRGSLFIGRFQPFHDAHKEIVNQLVKEGKYPVIAIKDMPTSSDNPFNAVAVARNIRKELRTLDLKEGRDYEVTIIPYIDEIVVGRTPGHSLRELKLDKKFEAISGTRIREKMVANLKTLKLPKIPEVKPYCLWLTGMPNAGKSTVSYELLQNRLRNCVVIDGDKFRERVNPELSFTREDILLNNKTAIKVCKYMLGLGFNVIVAMITPFQQSRTLARKELGDSYYEVFLDVPESERAKRPNFRKSAIPYETPKNPDLILRTHLESVQESAAKVLKMLGRHKDAGSSAQKR